MTERTNTPSCRMCNDTGSVIVRAAGTHDPNAGAVSRWKCNHDGTVSLPGESALRPCTCHPDDNPPRPCPGKFALFECRVAAQSASSESVPTGAKLKRLREAFEALIARIYPSSYKACMDPVLVELDGAINDFLNAAPIPHWTCGCGHVNGCNLEWCAMCYRRPNGRHKDE